MKEFISYFGEIIVITAVSGILLTAAPEGNMKKYIQFVISVCVLAAVVAPMISMISDLPKTIKLKELEYEAAGSEEAENIENAVVSASKREIEEAISSLVHTKFGIDKKEIDVEIRLDAADLSAIEITEIHVTIPKRKGVDAKKIRAYLEEMFLGKSAVYVTEREASKT